MSTWLISVVGVVVVGVLVELLLTDSPMSKFVRSIYAFFILFVIVQPLPGFLKNASENVGGAVQLDTQLLQNINSQTASACQRNVENALKTAGFENIIVTLDTDKSAAAFTIKSVYVNAWNVVLTMSNKNIDIKKEVLRIVTAVLNVKEDQVDFYA